MNWDKIIQVVYVVIEKGGSMEPPLCFYRF